MKIILQIEEDAEDFDALQDQILEIEEGKLQGSPIVGSGVVTLKLEIEDPAPYFDAFSSDERIRTIAFDRG